MVKILIGNITSKIIGYLPQEVNEQLDKVLSYRIKDAHYLWSVKTKKWDGVYHLYRKNQGQSFYSGLLSLVEEVLKLNKIEFTRTDERIRPDKNLPNLCFNPPPEFEERDYQKFTVERSIQATRGVLKIATGGGKTTVVAQLIGKIQTYPFMFYVLTEDLMQQAYDVLSGSLNEPIGRIGGGEFDIKKINVCTIQTAIMSLNAGNNKFNIDDYKFDEEDSAWNEDQMLNAEKLEQLRKLIGMTKGLYFDECLDGDTVITTERGKTTIGNAVKNKHGFVKTYDGNSVVFKPVLNWWDKGKKEVLSILLINGETITCTKNHLFYTKRGWIKAENLKKTDLLFFANADAEKKSLIQINTDQESTYLDIKLNGEQNANGKKYINRMSKICQNVNADAVREFYQDINLSKNSLDRAEQLADMRNIFSDMISNEIIWNIIFRQPPKKNKLLLERALGIHLLDCLTEGQKIIGCYRLMDYAKKNGQTIKKNIYQDLMLKQKSLNVLDLEISQLDLGRLVFHLYQKFQKSYITKKIKRFRKDAWMLSEKLDLLGGFATMDQIVSGVSRYIRKGILENKIKQSKNGLIIMDSNVKYRKQEKTTNDYITSDSTLMAPKKYQTLLEDMSPNVCHTNWIAIDNIKKKRTKRQVFDIEVKDTHCFFANNILVHNCHHTSAKTVKEVLTASPYSFWRFGGSATPYREDGAEIMIQAMFGKKIVDISATYLIKNNYLVEPYIIFDPIHHECKYHSYPSIYKDCIVGNKDFNTHVADLANHLVSKGLSTLILVKQYSQGEFIQKLIPNTEFLTSKINSEKRKKVIQDLRDRKKMCLIATTLADEGLDIPTLDAALLAGGGASSTRVHQRIGRTLRKDKNGVKTKNRSLVIYFQHEGAKYLDKHAKKARKIIKTEPKFNIIDSAGPTFIKTEIDEIMNKDENKKESTFSL